MDLIEQTLLDQLNQHPADLPGLWIADENLIGLASLTPRPGLTLLTNRFDVYQAAQEKGWEVRYSDFDLSPWPEGSLQRIYYRVSKEKAVVHHLINQAALRLAPGGQLQLFGAKQEGTKTYFDKARKYLGDGQLNKLGKGGFFGELSRGEQLIGEPLDDRDYPRLRRIDDDFISKPGLFGWDKLDAGSALMVEQFDSIWPRLSQPTPKVLDLGCGYGYLSVKAFRQGVESIRATDNNAAAVMACRQNFERLEIPGDVVADNCAAGINERHDLVLCNPPFHQGFSVEGELTDRFIATAARLCNRDGLAVFVVNRFIPLERKASSHFGKIETLADNGSFKVLLLSQPKKG
ncbi:methyltransferase [Motiliproteus sp.]|uniref:methyltransferase n=1 Tax=Motiliproteus sp. TaxID=1898955 RepID=UPI003BAD7CEC